MDRFSSYHTHVHTVHHIRTRQPRGGIRTRRSYTLTVSRTYAVLLCENERQQSRWVRVLSVRDGAQDQRVADPLFLSFTPSCAPCRSDGNDPGRAYRRPTCRGPDGRASRVPWLGPGGYGLHGAQGKAWRASHATARSASSAAHTLDRIGQARPGGLTLT